MKKLIFFALFALFAASVAAQPAITDATRFFATKADTAFKPTALNLKNYIAASGGGTVTSVALALPADFSVTGSPITGAGTLTGAWANQTTNKVFAAPNGSTGTPTFRALVAADIPTIAASQVTGANLTAASSKVSVTGGTGAVLNAATVDIVPANITITDLAGTLTPAKGGTGLTSVGTDVSVLSSNGTANVYLTPSVTTTAAAIAYSRNGTNLELNLPNADASNRGTVSTGTQTFAGAKTFSGALTGSSTGSFSGLLTGSAGVVATATASVAAVNVQGVADADYIAPITSGSTTLDQTHNYVPIGTLTAAGTIALPDCNSTRDGWEYRIERQPSADTFALTIDPNSTQTFSDAAATKVLYQGTSILCKCRSSNNTWFFSTH